MPENICASCGGPAGPVAPLVPGARNAGSIYVCTMCCVKQAAGAVKQAWNAVIHPGPPEEAVALAKALRAIPMEDGRPRHYLQIARDLA
jgi:hypothetical protein